jgi:hypothetical protein
MNDVVVSSGQLELGSEATQLKSEIVRSSSSNDTDVLGSLDTNGDSFVPRLDAAAESENESCMPYSAAKNPRESVSGSMLSLLSLSETASSLEPFRNSRKQTIHHILMEEACSLLALSDLPHSTDHEEILRKYKRQAAEPQDSKLE